VDELGYIKAPDGTPLYVAYHAGGDAAPVVIAPPLFEERKSAYAPLRRLAEKLAAAGHPVLRFDYRGSGESGGDPGARHWPHLAEDLAAARAAIVKLSGKDNVVLLGLRLGGTLVLQEALKGGVDAVIALAPIVSGAAQVRQWKMRTKIRAELTSAASGSGGAAAGSQDAGGPVDFDGYAVHPGFFDDVAAVDLVKSARPLACPGLIVQISHRTDPARESAQFVAALGAQAKLECLRLEPFWDKLDDVDTRPVEDIVVRTVAGFTFQVSS
jgi:pimeloyl-ACP methyl ester carboxylesterase